MHSIFHSANYLPQQMVIYLLVFVISSVSTLFILENRFDSKWKTFLLSVGIWYLFVFPKHFDNLPIWTNQIILSSFFMSNILLYKDKFRTKMLTAVISVTINMFADYFTYFMTIVVFHDNVDTYLHKPYVFIMMGSVSLTLFLLDTLLWNKFYRNDKNNFFKNNLMILILVAVLNVNLLSVLIPMITNIVKYLSPELKNSLNSFFMISFILMLISYMVLFYFIRSSHQYQKMKDENEKLDFQNKLQAEYYKKIESTIHQTARLRHDINNIVQTINLQLAQNTPESYEKAKMMTQELNELTENIQPLKYCHNRVVDVVLDDKIRSAKKSGITVLCDVMLEEREDVSDLDICRIFANLLDNAVHATEHLPKAEDKKITVICKEKADGIYIKCENCFDSKTEKDTRSEKSLHGYGLKIIQEISRKYNGMLTLSQKDNVFTALVVLKTG